MWPMLHRRVATEHRVFEVGKATVAFGHQQVQLGQVVVASVGRRFGETSLDCLHALLVFLLGIQNLATGDGAFQAAFFVDVSIPLLLVGHPLFPW